MIGQRLERPAVASAAFRVSFSAAMLLGTRIIAAKSARLVVDSNLMVLFFMCVLCFVDDVCIMSVMFSLVSQGSLLGGKGLLLYGV
jgi:hypothetical protein